MTTLPPHMTVAEALRFMQTQPGLYRLEVQHDDGCPAIRTQNDNDCARWCNPRYRLHRGTPQPTTPQTKVKRGKR